jgi:hypothetical protein
VSAGTDEDLIDGEEADADFPELESIKRGTIRDYVSGKMVQAAPEELEAVQVMSRRLVEDFGYPISHLRTRPQWRVATSLLHSTTRTTFSAMCLSELKKGRHACLPRL